MLETTATKLRKSLNKEIASCFNNHETLHVKQRNGKDFIIISEEDWQAIQETLFLNKIPNMVESIHHAAQEPLTQGTKLKDLDW